MLTWSLRVNSAVYKAQVFSEIRLATRNNVSFYGFVP